MSHDDFATEPVKGLPERPPEGERILWQGRPQAWALTWQALSLPWVAGYFAALAVWRFGSLIDATLVPCQRALDDAGLTVADIDEVGRRRGTNKERLARLRVREAQLQRVQ